MSEAMQRQGGHMPAWLLFSGLAIGVLGASVNKHAETVGQLVVALRGRTENSDATVAGALGQWGLLLLVVGAVAVLAGLVVITRAGRHKQRRRAMDPRRCSVASGCGTSAPSLCSKPSQRVGGARAWEWRRCGQRPGSPPPRAGFRLKSDKSTDSAVTAQRLPDRKTLRSARTQLCVTSVTCQLSFARRLI
jgi:hypothetical protein